MTESGAAEALSGYPGAVLRLDGAGTVVGSNGRMESAVGIPVVGRPLVEVLDASSSASKWRAMLEAAARETQLAELILCRDGQPQEPRPFALFAGGGGLWLFELREDPRLALLATQASEVNSELVGAQRALVKEQRRLAHALEAEQRLVGVVEAQRAELTRSNAALDEFAHVVSHDLKAPLRALDAFARWVEEDPAVGALGERASSGLARLRDRVERLRRMIDGALAYARAGRLEAAPERMEMEPLLENVLTLADASRFTCVQVAPGATVVTAERAPLQQVLLNLISNAVRFASGRPAPAVRVQVEAEGELAVFTVADNGPGIPPEQIERIWGLFQAGGEGGGTGVGLAVVRKEVEARGGTVEVTSVPGEGATFRFTWPMKQEWQAAGLDRDQLPASSS